MEDLTLVELSIKLIRKCLKKYKLILFTTIVFTGLGVVYTKVKQKEYTASFHLRSNHFNYPDIKNAFEIINYYCSRADYTYLSEHLDIEESVLRNIKSMECESFTSLEAKHFLPPTYLKANFVVYDTSAFDHLEPLIQKVFEHNPTLKREIEITKESLVNNENNLNKAITKIDSLRHSFETIVSDGNGKMISSPDNFVKQQMNMYYSLSETHKKIQLISSIDVISELRSNHPVNKNMLIVFGAFAFGLVFGISIVLVVEMFQIAKQY